MEHQGGCLGMFLGTLRASFSGTLLVGKCVFRVGDGIMHAGENF